MDEIRNATAKKGPQGACKEVLGVAVCQMTSVDDLGINQSSIEKALQQLGSNPPDLICFPENAFFLRVQEPDPYPAMELSHPVMAMMCSWAKSHGSTIHLGSVPMVKDGHIFNSSVLISSDGEPREVYRKIHLFDVDVEGQKPIRESDDFRHGEEPMVIEVQGWRLGCTICYDLRFAELFTHYSRLEVDALLIPAAFLVSTGQAHWEVLTRARAIECQAYVLAAAQGGVHRGRRGGERHTYGHSMVIDPWGRVLQVASAKQQGVLVLQSELRKEQISKVRTQIPMKSHRRREFQKL